MRLAILGHLLNINDARNAVPFGHYLPMNALKKILSLREFSSLSHYSILGKTDGYFIILHATASELIKMDKDEAKNKILKSIIYAQNKLNCDLVMLGALTAPLTSAGVWLRQQPELNKIKITTGNTFTAAITVQAAEQIINLSKLNPYNIKLAIVGAAGVIGEAITKYFNQKNFNLILIERDNDRFSNLKPQLRGDKYILSSNLKDIIEADLVITATSHPDAIINGDILKRNAIVIDVAEPSDVVSNIEKIRPDVISIDGGRIDWKNKIDTKVNFGTAKGVGLACMTEGLMQALENDYEDHIGSIDMEHFNKTIEWSKKWDFKLAHFTCFNKPISLEKFKNIKI